MTQTEAACFLTNPLALQAQPHDLKVLDQAEASCFLTEPRSGQTDPHNLDSKTNSTLLRDLPGVGTGAAHHGYSPTFILIGLEVRDTINRRPALMDTGASISLIDVNLAKDNEIPIKEGTVTINGIGSKRTLGFTTIDFVIRGFDRGGPHQLRCRHDFYVVDKLLPGIIIGSEWIHGQRVAIDLHKGRASIPLPDGPVHWVLSCLRSSPSPPPAVQLHCHTTLTIAAGYQALVRVKWDHEAPPDASYVLEANLWLDKLRESAFCTPSCLVSGITTHILVTNLGRNDIVIDAGMPLAGGSLLDTPCAATGEAFHLHTAPHSCYTLGPTEHKAPPDTDCRPLEGKDDLDFFIRGAQSDDSESVIIDEVFKVGVTPGSTTAPREVVEILRDKKAAFSLDGRPGHLRGPQMSIPVKDEKLLRSEPPRRTSPQKRQIIHNMVDQLLEMGIIEPSSSRISSPIVLIPQNGKTRFCVDYRTLNNATDDDRYPLPRADDIFDAFSGATVFSSVDMVKAYHQAELREEDRWKTAFSCDKGLFQYRRVPFGLKGAPAFFQRCMDNLLGSMRWAEALVYLDDIIIFSRSMDSHLKSLRKLLDLVISAGVKLDPKKCHFAFRGLKVLGRHISVDGVSIIEDRAKAIRNLKRPDNLAGLWRILGLWNYYRSHIPSFAARVAPLQSLTEGLRWESKGVMVDQKGVKCSAKMVAIDWTPERAKCFEEMNKAVASLTTLAFPIEGRKYFLYIDASQSHFAAALHQQHLKPLPSSLQANIVSECSLAITALHDTTLQNIRKYQKEDPSWARHVAAARRGQTPEGYTWERDILIREIDGKICLPRQMFLSVFKEAHAGHFGFGRTMAIVERDWWHPKLGEAVQSFVDHCATCLRTKLRRPSGELAEDEDFNGLPFETISVDLMLGLPKSPDGEDACLIILDTFSKTVLLRPMKSTAKAIDIAKELENSVIRMGWKPNRIISDHDTRFMGQVGKALAEKLGAKLTPTAPYHQQANPVERYVQTVIKVLTALCVEKDVTDWPDLIPSTELVLNATPSTVTGYAAFDLLYIHRPKLLDRLTRHAGTGDIEERFSFSQVRVNQAREALRLSRVRSKHRFDKRKAPLPKLKEGDLVMLRLKDRPLFADRIHSKIQPPKEGPFKVKEVISKHRVKLDLADDMGGSDIWDTSQLEPVPDNDKYGRPGLRPEGSGITWWEIDRIVDHRTRRGKPQYRVKWKDSSRLTWVDESTLLEDGCSESINDYRETIADNTAQARQPHQPSEIPHAPDDAGYSTPPLEDRIRVDSGSESEGEAEAMLASKLANLSISDSQIPRFNSAEDALDKEPIHQSKIVIVDGQKHLLLERPVSFSSKKTSKSERKLLGAELELKGLLWAFYFYRIYLEGAEVGIVTDHMPIKAMLQAHSHRDFSSLIQKVRQELQPYIHRWTFHYKPGKTHTNVDALSRIPQIDEDENSDEGTT